MKVQRGHMLRPCVCRLAAWQLQVACARGAHAARATREVARARARARLGTHMHTPHAQRRGEPDGTGVRPRPAAAAQGG